MLLATTGFTPLVIPRIGWRDAGPVIGPPLETAGAIIPITAAGGAFGAMIKLAGMGKSARSLTTDFAVQPVLLAWLPAGALRVAQGSTTVAMITAARSCSPCPGRRVSPCIRSTFSPPAATADFQFRG